MMSLKKKKSKGFTLIELMVVIVIIGVLLSVAIPRITGQYQDAQYDAGGDGYEYYEDE